MRCILRTIGWSCAVLLLLAPVQTVHSADEDPRPPGKLGEELDWMRDVLRNADAKLRGNVVGVRAPEAATPARVCCSRNLERLEESRQKLVGMLSGLAECYELEEDDTMIASAQFVRLDLQALAAAVEGFAGAADRPAAFTTFGAVTRSYIKLRDSAWRLRPCGEEGGSRPEQDTSKKKKKKKKQGDEVRPKAPAE